MGKRKFAWADVAIGAVVSLLVLAVFWMNLAEGLEGKLYDVRAKLRAGAKTADNVVLIGIDDDSIKAIGRWPWPRSYMAEMVNKLAENQAKVIALDIFVSNAEINPGLDIIRGLKEGRDSCGDRGRGGQSQDGRGTGIRQRPERKRESARQRHQARERDRVRGERGPAHVVHRGRPGRQGR